MQKFSKDSLLTKHKEIRKGNYIFMPMYKIIAVRDTFETRAAVIIGTRNQRVQKILEMMHENCDNW